MNDSKSEVLATPQGFLDFINEQPDDRKINHDSWDSCATGDYIKSVGIQAPSCFNEMSDRHKQYDLFDSLSRKLTSSILLDSNLSDSDTLYHPLVRRPVAKELASTYGDLKALVKGAKVDSLA